MQTLLLTFANSSTNRLPTLDDEYQGVSNALRERNTKDFYVVSDPILNRDKFVKDLEKYGKDTCLFLFSGHAGRDSLGFEDGKGYADGIALLLGNCPNLNIVILNGCSTGGQVRLLRENGVPVVIATSAPVNDETATQFSISIFEELAQKRKSIKDSFEEAIKKAKLYGQVKNCEITSRGLGSDQEEAALWGVYYDEDKADILDTWRLPENIGNLNTSNSYLKNTLQLIFEEQLK